jgi:hypothetical protein
MNLADLSIIARSLPAFSSNDLGGDAKVAAYVYRGHAWLETNGGPVGIEDAGAAELAAQADTSLAEIEQARVASASNTALTGHEAIAYAQRYGLDLTKRADPTEEACVVTVDEAIEIAKEDPSLIEIEAPTWDPTRMTTTCAAVGNDGRRPCVWGLGTSPEMASGVEVQERVQHGDVTWP